MDEDAGEACAAIRDFLVSQGLTAQVVDDSAPGVPQGTFEVRVHSAESEQAEKLIAQNFSGQKRKGDASRKFDLESVFHSEGSTTAEFEALSVKNLLEANGIPAVLVGDSVLPNFPFEVRVPRDQAQLARQLIAEAEADRSNQ